MNKKIINVFKMVIILVVTVSLILSFIVSQNSYHIDNCHEEHCFECAIIHVAQTIIKLSVTVFIYIVISFLIYFILSRMHKETTVLMQKSLVFQEVQKNE